MAKTEYNKLLKLLKESGFEEVKAKGHRQFKHPITHKKITLTKEVTKNIELSVRRQIKENERILNEKV